MELRGRESGHFSPLMALKWTATVISSAQRSSDQKKNHSGHLFNHFENWRSFLKGAMCWITFLHQPATPLNPVVGLPAHVVPPLDRMTLLLFPPPIRAIAGKCRTEQAGVFELHWGGWLWHTGWHTLRQEHCSHKGTWKSFFLPQNGTDVAFCTSGLFRMKRSVNVQSSPHL